MGTRVHRCCCVQTQSWVLFWAPAFCSLLSPAHQAAHGTLMWCMPVAQEVFFFLGIV